MTISHLSRAQRKTHLVPRQQRQSDVDRNRIVVGVDTSRWGLAALSWAAGQARVAGMDLDVCAAPTDSRPGSELAHQLREIRRWAAQRTVPVLPSVDAASSLIAASRRAGLVVLGCRGTSTHGIGIGAAVRAVARSAACDVVVVGGQPAALTGTHGRICVLVDERAPLDAVASAVRFATRRDARLRVVAQVSPAGRTPSSPGPESSALHDATDLARLLAPGLDVTTRAAVGDPHEVVAALTDVDLLVVAGRGVAGIARAALYHARCPVLLAR